MKLGPPDGKTKFWAISESSIPGHPQVRDQGVWWVSNNSQFCTQFDTWQGGQASCYPIEQAGGKKFRWASNKKAISLD